MNSIVVTSTKQNIKFGYEGEDNVTKIIFPYDESWLEYGEGNFEVRILRCGDEVAYTATEVVDDRQAMTLTMTVTDIELSVRGRGEMQLCYVCPDSIKKSPIYQYTVNRSVDYKYAVDPPDGSIIASVEKSLSEIKNTTNRLSNSVISIENSINDANSQIDNINNKISEFDEEIDSIGEVETRVDNLETSTQSINGRINTAEGNINENTESISDLNESVTELENRKVTDLETSGGKSDSGKYLTVGTDGKIKATSLTIPPTITVDKSLSTTSTNPVQNKVIKTELNNINSNIETCNTEISKLNGSLGDVSDELELITAAVPEDVGNALTVKRVVGGKVVEWDFSPAGSSSSGMSEEIKSALLNFLSCAALSDLNGVGYYNTLYGLLISDVNVLSIDAVFTQGQTIVHNTSNLQDLRSMLVVTATYDDESTRVITEYALRGSLNVGDSTITVVYGKKTDTFTVHVTDVDTPAAGYTKIDWVWADNAAGNDWATRWTFVKSGYTPSQTTGIETKFEYHSLIGNGRLFDAVNYRIWLNKNVTINRCGNEIARTNAIPNIAVNTPMEFSIFMNNTDDVVMDGNTLFSVSSGESTTGEMIFFTSGASDAVRSDAKIYYVKFYENGSLVRNYIPCKRDSDDVIGLYETITGTFHVGARNPLKGPES